MDNQKIGAFIAARRKEMGLTQQQLAERLGVTNKAVSKWESGVFPKVKEIVMDNPRLHISFVLIIIRLR